MKRRISSHWTVLVQMIPPPILTLVTFVVLAGIVIDPSEALPNGIVVALAAG
jgi:hypothetical protein